MVQRGEKTVNVGMGTASLGGYRNAGATFLINYPIPFTEIPTLIPVGNDTDTLAPTVAGASSSSQGSLLLWSFTLQGATDRTVLWEAIGTWK